MEVVTKIQSYFQHWGNHLRRPIGSSSIGVMLPPADDGDGGGDCTVVSAFPAFQKTNVANICVCSDDFQQEFLPRLPC